MRHRLVVLGVVAGLALAAPAARGETTGGGDHWFAPDKVKHFLMSAFVQSLTYGTLRATHLGHGSSLVGASVVTVALGAGKELHDRRTAGDDFSFRDLTWDLAGGGAATLLIDRTRH